MTKELNDRLFEAVRSQNSKEISECLKKGADINAISIK